MSRSIHTTRRTLKDEERFIYSAGSAEQRADKLRQLCEKLAKKRRIKNQVKTERLGAEQFIESVLPESIPIRVLDEGEFIHYPATPTDILNVMRLLPRGVLDGISCIELCLGEDYQEDDGETDPFVGRHSYEMLPGIFSGHYLGSYNSKQARIRLFAYVYAPSIADREMWELYLRLNMLSTLVHEIAHHNDYRRRVARGRWLADSTEKKEIYAEKIQQEWVQQYVIPYLEPTYSEPLKALNAWIQHYGGVSIPLSLLVGDPRVTTNKSGVFKDTIIFNLSSAFEVLAKDVAEGEKLVDTRLQFARQLHYVENYAEALEIIEGILADYPEHLEALTLKADIYEHQQKYDEAQVLLERVILIDETYVNAWEVLTFIHRDRQDWENCVTAATRAVELHPVGNPKWERWLAQRAAAKLELNDFKGVEADIEQLLEQGKQFAARKASELQEKMRSRIDQREENR